MLIISKKSSTAMKLSLLNKDKLWI